MKKLHSAIQSLKHVRNPKLATLKEVFASQLIAWTQETAAKLSQWIVKSTAVDKVGLTPVTNKKETTPV
jgi:hypothetical protein